jgi:hypothetical protein
LKLALQNAHTSRPQRTRQGNLRAGRHHTQRHPHRPTLVTTGSKLQYHTCYYTLTSLYLNTSLAATAAPLDSQRARLSEWLVCVVITDDTGCSGDEAVSLPLSATCATPLSTIANTATELAHSPWPPTQTSAGARRTIYNIHVHAGNDGRSSSSSVTY